MGLAKKDVRAKKYCEDQEAAFKHTCKEILAKSGETGMQYYIRYGKAPG